MARNRSNGKKNVQGKRLIDRVIPMDKVAKVSIPKKTPAERTKEGFSVVNGKLVSSNDIGVLLREAQGAIDRRNNVSQKKKKRKGIHSNRNANDRKQININTSTEWSNGPQELKWTPSEIKRGQKLNDINKFHDSRGFDISNGEVQRRSSQLVISTNSDASDKLLMLFNLTLGVNHKNLKDILESISQVQIAQIRVRDLPSGSATAKVRLAYPTTQSLEKVRKLFHGALVDGRRIQVVIASDESSHLSY
ncbi:hypothetical protein SMKI_08G1690 [Saccharomyces mikatae IFO 1815]|uniref:YHR127W-like protein n=1 Tax=Saccharomyces mikatae IFO 1815 TaxID=226126 RepID=A0AA35J1M9_SACMI|nr:uncharacterized protein SMKI_08G1690 [Saccharomyces mikatae IFO 1815]CAI4039502.1 hypothetical protein SMKI_08G1690 [Saccharomyces mikatae IFO 1815]